MSTLSNFCTDLDELLIKTSDVPDPIESQSSVRAAQINLIEKISHGQFSTVWKGVCAPNKEAEEEEGKEIGEKGEEDYYAIKIFASHQKTAWFNEKEIYNLLWSSPNVNILKYYGTDVHTPSRSQQQAAVANQPVFFSSFPTNEFWLITEYHSLGSLHDYLKENHVSWQQMVKLCNCILEGLAYLHGENVELRKMCAIAHRDLKSKNILVKNGAQACCIGDLGLALKLNNSNKLNSAEIRNKVKPNQTYL